jgi:hypothetical protein
LSAFNEGDTRNVVYILSDTPQRIDHIPRGYIQRQIAGEQLYMNLTKPLPLRIIGGGFIDIPGWRMQNLATERNPQPHSGLALELFASDLLAARTKRLSHEFEELEQQLLEIGERLGLRGQELDNYHHEALTEARDMTLKNALENIKRMTLTVVDGDFSRDVLARDNLTFSTFAMPSARNAAKFYDAKLYGPAPARDGKLFDSGALDKGRVRRVMLPLGALVVGFLFLNRRANRNRRLRGSARTMWSIVVLTSMLSTLAVTVSARERVSQLINRLDNTENIDATVDQLIALGDQAVKPLLDEAANGQELASRGWAIVALSEIGGDEAFRGLARIHNDGSEATLVRTWAAAARVSMAEDLGELMEVARLANELPPLNRPVGQRAIELVSSGASMSVESMVEMTVQSPQLQQALVQPIISGGPKPLIEVMLTAQNQQVRWTATSYLATLAQQGDESVADAVIVAYRYKRSAEALPWQGGPLYIPGINWEKHDAIRLTENLTKWLLFCERQRRDGEERQVLNNIRSWQLANVAGYDMAGTRDAASWYETWGRTFGKNSLKRIFQEQGVENKAPYRDILRAL